MEVKVVVKSNFKPSLLAQKVEVHVGMHIYFDVVALLQSLLIGRERKTNGSLFVKFYEVL